LLISPCTPLTRPPICLIAAVSASWRRPVMNTVAPSAAKALAVARPMPLVPPVTTTTLLSNLCATCLSPSSAATGYQPGSAQMFH
jgi:hypothetical protein